MAQPRRLLVALACLALAGCGGAKHTATTTAATTPASRFPALSVAKTYDVTLKTNHGSFTIRLDQRTSPHTTASFVALVKRGFFDGTIFHRIVPGFVIQGGDPTGTGTGGPGYTTVDRPPASTQYTHGVVAMAKTQAQPPGTSGSQFFVVTARNAHLPPDYAVLGRVVRGLAVVDRIGTLGNANEQPTERVVIEHASVAVH